jgi:glutamine amidotransferase
VTTHAAPRIGVCDYGVGNLRSVERALAHGGGNAVLSADARELAGCDGLVLPGVGAFVVAARALRSRGLDAAIGAVAGSGRPILGVCLGFQLLFSDSDEGDGESGLGLIPGRVRRLRPARGKVPHMGWNRLRVTRPSSLLTGVDDGSYAYFVHSYAAIPDDEGCVVAVTDHGGEIVAAVQAGNITGTQFHPEKSAAAGLRVYANFVAACTNFVSRCTAAVRA